MRLPGFRFHVRSLHLLARVIVCCAACLLLPAAKADAQGNLLITPRRVIFDGARRSQELNLANTGNDTARYVISLIEFEMKEDGSFVMLKDTAAGGHYASPYLRFFPRSVTLGPNESQTLKVQLVNARELPAGEYRSHFYFRAVPDQQPLGEQAPPPKDSSISVSIIPVFGISIPAIVRVGETSATTAFSDVRLDLREKEPTLHLAFNRTGNISVYGHLTVTHIAPNGKETQAGLVKGVAVYTPLPRRTFNMSLDAGAGIDYHSGKLRLVFNDASAGNAMLAETEINLN